MNFFFYVTELTGDIVSVTPTKVSNGNNNRVFHANILIHKIKVMLNSSTKDQFP